MGKLTKLQHRHPREVIYTPESRLSHPRVMLWEMWRDLLASRELAWRLLVRDISAKYRQSVLGILWAMIPAVVTAAGFTLAKNNGVVNIEATDLPYPAYVMFGMTLWQTFIAALNAPLQGLSSGKSMLARINFPREALVLSKLGEVFFDFGTKLILIIVLFIWFKMPVTISVILAPVALIHLVALGTFIGLLLAPIGTLYQDISRVIGLFSSFWLFLTPVVYPVPSDGVFGTIVKLNPVTTLLVTTRELATTGTISDPMGFWIVSAISMVGLFVAWIIYRISIPYVVERISS